MFRWATLFHAPTVISATSEATDFPRSRVADRTRPNRAWRSTSTLQQDLVLDLGVSVSFEAVALHHANFATVELAHSADNLTYTSFTGSPFAVSQDLKDGYRKLIVVETLTRRYVRVRIPVQAPVDGAAYFSLGTVFVVEALRALPDGADPFVPLQIVRQRPMAAIEVGGRREAAPLGDSFVEQTWRTNGEEALMDEPLALALQDEHQRLLVFWNRGRPNEVYYCQPFPSPRIEHQGVTLQVGFGLRQVT